MVDLEWGLKVQLEEFGVLETSLKTEWEHRHQAEVKVCHHPRDQLVDGWGAFMDGGLRTQ